MKLIQLTQGKFAKVDDEDHDRLCSFKWYAHVSGSNLYYAIRNVKLGYGKNNRSAQKMHREILIHHGILIDEEKFVDHVDGDTLNNQKYNLRVCNEKENASNVRKRENTSSKYKGVGVFKGNKRNDGSQKLYWQAHVSIGGKPKRIGLFPYTKEGEIEAAKAYDKEAAVLYGEFSKLNFK